MNTNPCSREFELGETQIFLKNFINNLFFLNANCQ